MLISQEGKEQRQESTCAGSSISVGLDLILTQGSVLCTVTCLLIAFNLCQPYTFQGTAKWYFFWVVHSKLLAISHDARSGSRPLLTTQAQRMTLQEASITWQTHMGEAELATPGITKCGLSPVLIIGD